MFIRGLYAYRAGGDVTLSCLDNYGNMIYEAYIRHLVKNSKSIILFKLNGIPMKKKNVN